MKGRSIPYTAEELSFIRSVSAWQRSEAHAAFCQKFQRDDVSPSNFNALCKRNGWFTGRTGCFAKGEVPHNKGKPCPPGRGGRHPNAQRTQFKSGQLPHNANYLGHERIDATDGYVYVSVDEPNPHTGYERRYVLKHKWLWEQLHGPVPDGHALKCLDSNKLNVDPANWEPIPRALLPTLNGGRHKTRLAYDAAPDELKPTIMAIAKLSHRSRERRSA